MRRLACGSLPRALSPPVAVAHARIHQRERIYFRYTLTRPPTLQCAHKPTRHRQYLAPRASPQGSGGSLRSHHGPPRYAPRQDRKRRASRYSLSARRPSGRESAGPALLTLRPGHWEALRPPLRSVPSARP